MRRLAFAVLWCFSPYPSSPVCGPLDFSPYPFFRHTFFFAIPFFSPYLFFRHTFSFAVPFLSPPPCCRGLFAPAMPFLSPSSFLHCRPRFVRGPPALEPAQTRQFAPGTASIDKRPGGPPGCRPCAPLVGTPLPQGIRPFPRAVHTGRAVDPPVDLAHNFDQVRLKCVTGPGGWPTLYGKNAVLGPPP